MSKPILVICDDESDQRSYLRKQVESIKPNTYEILECQSADALEDLKIQQPYILFLDISMDREDDGFEYARKLAESNSLVSIIFTTGRKEYAEKSYDVDASFFILKPASAQKVKSAIRRAERDIRRRKVEKFNSECLFVGSSKIPQAEVLLVETNREIRGVSIRTRDEIINLSGIPLNQIEKMLNPDEFIKTHSSIIVQMSKIENLTKRMVKVKWIDEEFPVSRHRSNQVIEKYKEYFGELTRRV